MHPDWQDRARQEVFAVVGRHDLPTKDHLPKLKTVRADAVDCLLRARMFLLGF
jgi:hypothetical protein